MSVVVLCVTEIMAQNTVAQAKLPKVETETSNIPQLRQIPLVVQRVFIPNIGIGEKDISASDSVAMLDNNAMLDIADTVEPDADVIATLIGAKQAGWTAGYEFMPAAEVKKGESPRTVIAKIETQSEYLLLVRVSTRLPDFGHGALIIVMADATLYRRSDLKPVFGRGFIGGGKVDAKEQTGNEVKGEYWMRTVAAAFARNFDQTVLAKMQTVFDRRQIDSEIMKMKQVTNAKPLTASVTDLGGGTNNLPQLNIVMGKAGLQVVAYLESKSGENRKWQLGSNQEVDVHVTPGQYTIYTKLCSDQGQDSDRTCRSLLSIQYNKRYSLKVE